jgi:hypothetical protein
MIEKEYRPLTESERAIFDRLLEKSFPGRNELVQQLQDLLVKRVDEEGSLSLKVSSSVLAPVQGRIAVDARYVDSDTPPDSAVHVHILLHVVNGRMVELEFYKDDGSSIKKRPHPNDLVVGWD